MLLRNSDALILNHQKCPAKVCGGAYGDVNVFRRSVLDRVGKQIIDDLLSSHGIPFADKGSIRFHFTNGTGPIKLGLIAFHNFPNDFREIR